MHDEPMVNHNSRLRRAIPVLTMVAALATAVVGVAIAAGPEPQPAKGSLAWSQQYLPQVSTRSGNHHHRSSDSTPTTLPTTSTPPSSPAAPASTGTTGASGTTGAPGQHGPTPVPSTTTTTAARTPAATPPTGRWEPTASATVEWQWELDHPLSLTSAADLGTADPAFNGDQPPATDPSVYDIDGFDNSAATVAGLHARGAKVICYIDVGTAEDWRPDASQFPAALLGSSNGWAGERWLDTNPAGPDYATLQAIMEARFAMCQAKGFDAVEPDNMDGSENSTGFAITDAQQDAYDEWVAAAVHALGMSVAQKNFEDQSAVLEPSFDFVIEEQCFQYQDCSDLAPYTAADKAVLEVEYADQGADPASYCPTAIADRFSSVEFDTDLDAGVRVPCA